MTNLNEMLNDDTVNDDLFSLDGLDGLDGDEQIVYLLKQITKNQKMMVGLMVGISELLKDIRG